MMDFIDEIPLFYFYFGARNGLPERFPSALDDRYVE